jgi:flagellar motor switch protein FliG
MEMNEPEKSLQVLESIDEKETQTLENSMSTLGEADTPVMDSESKDFYNLVEASSSKLNREGMDFLESALIKVIDSVKAGQVLKNITSP